MKKLVWFGFRVGALGALAALCTGCPNPNTYGTPRTTPAGRVQHTIAAEGIGLSFRNPDFTDPSTGQKREGLSGGFTVPNFPTYQVRVGVADTVDIGARLANMSSLGADVKWNFIKGDTFDMAVVPGFQAFHYATTLQGVSSDVTIFYGNLPLLFGINVSDNVTIVPSLGATYAFSSADARAGDEDEAISQGGIWLRGGIGFNFRISPKFAMHPEITFLKILPDDGQADALLYVFGLGFNFGALPVYGSPEPEAR
jgi:hypothetical protein